MSKIDLKIEGLTLAERSRILKRLARSKNYNPELRKTLEHRRVHEVRREARSNHIAYSFLRGRTMEEIELPLRASYQGHISSFQMTRTAPDWNRIEELVREHGAIHFETEQEILQKFSEFKDGGQAVEIYSADDENVVAA